MTADARKAKAAAGLLEYENDGYRRYLGTRDQLIAAGLAKDGEFPGDPASGRATDHTFTSDDGRHIFIKLRSRLKGLFSVGIGPTKADLAATKAQQQRDRDTKQEAEAKQERADAEKKMASVPRNAAQYKTRVAASCEAVITAFVRRALVGKDSPQDEFKGLDRFADVCMDGMFGELGGYRLDDASLAAFDEAVEDIIEVIRDGTVRLDRRRHQYVLTELRAEVAQADPGFGRFMTTVTGQRA